MPVCSFCREAYGFPKGTTVVQKSGEPRYYCSSKCRKNSEMGRLNKKVKWVRKSDLVKAEKAKHEAGRVTRLEVADADRKAKAEKAAAKKAKKVAGKVGKKVVKK